MQEINRIYVTGGSGVGKTTLTKRLAEATGYPIFELDWVLWSRNDDGSRGLATDHVEKIGEIAAQPVWIADGSFVGFAQEIWRTADLIIFLDVSLRVMLWRVFWRHVKAEIRRNNRHPGWLNLFKFMKVVARSYRSPEIGDIDSYDESILTQAKIEAKVRQQAHKTLVFNGSPDIDDILRHINPK
jgi:adenylate kinase family enzyme